MQKKEKMVNPLAEIRLQKATVKMMWIFKFFGGLATSLQRVEDNTITTMGTDGKRLYYNSAFVLEQSIQELVFLVIHEILHVALSHCLVLRVKNRPVIWVKTPSGEKFTLMNIAMDYVVHAVMYEYLLGLGMLETSPSRTSAVREYLYTDRLVIKRNQHIAAPDFGLFVDIAYVGMTVEEVFDILYKKIKHKKAKYPNDNPSDDFELNCGRVIDHHLTLKELEEKIPLQEAKMEELKWKGKIQKEVLRAKMSSQSNSSKFYSLLESLILVQPKIDWRELLFSYVSHFHNTSYRYSPPNKKYISAGISIPSCYGETLEVILVTDTSFSMLQDIAKIYSHLHHIFMAFDSCKVRLIECDESIRSDTFYDIGEDFSNKKPKAYGGNGTDFRPVFDLINNESEFSEGGVKRLMLFTTDGYGVFPQHEPDYEVIWITTTGKTVKYPFGEVVELDLNGDEII